MSTRNEHPRLVIGLGGYMRHGKDAVADALEAHHAFRRLAMSDALHRALMTLDPIIDPITGPTGPLRYSEHVHRVGFIEAKKHPEVRRLQRVLGTEVVRDQLDADAWVNAARATMDAHYPRNVAVTGIRYPNELSLITGYVGGVPVWVDRPGMSAPDLSHSSERTLDASMFPVVVHNSGTLQDITDAAPMIIKACERWLIAIDTPGGAPFQLHVDTTNRTLTYQWED